MTTRGGSSGARGRAPSALAIALTITVVGGYDLIRSVQAGDDSVTASVSQQRGVACVHDVGMDEGYCARFVADLARRAPLTADQVGHAATAKTAVALALSGDVLNRCNVKHESCDSVMAWGERSATPDDVRSRLATLTANLPEVRAARPDDPAVAGSVLFGVLVGDVCVYGHQRLNKEPDRVHVAGLLPTGTCLAP